MAKKSQFAEMEERILDFWDKGKFFERSVAERPADNEFTFYDGPPFATGLPHYGHILAGTIKDAVPRYKTMQGHRVERVWGWDCHGLPIENMVEKELGFKAKRDIESLGIEKFNQACRDSVFKYEKGWKKVVHRIGRWIDMENAYKTMDNSYIESVWWVFSKLYKKGLIYKESRVLLFCPRCSTPLSNFEIAMGDSYKDVKDPAVTVRIKLKNESNAYLLVWTTTPWTLPANVALAVNPDINYLKVKLKETDEIYIFAESRKNEVLDKIVYPIEDDHELEMKVEFMGLIRGSRLVGREYEPLFDFIKPDKDCWKIIAGDFVTAEEGTGIVHIAPAFGEDDMRVARENDLPLIMTVDKDAKFLPEVKPWQGVYVKDADEDIMKELEKRGALFKRETHTHSYPHCWRCETPLIYMAQPAWYINVTKIKAKMKKNNMAINWHPEHFKRGRFGKGIETAPDWNFSRTRYWGAPIPVWECEACDEREIIGSIEELREKADYLPKDIDLHRPQIDEIKIKCACGKVMSRIPEVFDCWFESGSMPYGQKHYPFENKKWFQENFPADFIAEGQDQTRGWFYTLHVLGTALFEKPAYKNVVVNGIVLAEDGRKMSKSLKNFPDPWLIFDKYGVDALRYYLLTSPVIEAENLNFTERDVAEIEKKLLMVLLNVYKFFELYTRDLKTLPKAKPVHVLDKWIVTRFEKLLGDVTKAMDDYRLVPAVRPIQDFVTDLSTWYLRRSRERFKGADEKDKEAAVATLGWVLENLCLVMAPFTPFISEELWQKVTRKSDDSVHLQAWPKVEKKLVDEKLLENMFLVRDIVSRGLEARATAGFPVRQVLAGVKVGFKDEKLVDMFSNDPEFQKLIKDELNVEKVSFCEAKEDIGVELDTVLTPDLKKKGLLREIVRRVNAQRKKAGLTITDNIILYYQAEDALAQQVFVDMKDQLMAETITKELKNEKSEVDAEDLFKRDEQDIWLGIKKQ